MILFFLRIIIIFEINCRYRFNVESCNGNLQNYLNALSSQFLFSRPVDIINSKKEAVW